MKIKAKQPKIICQSCGTENSNYNNTCSSCNLSLIKSEIVNNGLKLVCPRCQYSNNYGTFFCYACGKYFVDSAEIKNGWRQDNNRKKQNKSLPVPKAKITIPGGKEIILDGTPTFIERSDFDSTLPYELLMCISRQHILITYSRGKYYVQDYGREGKGSTNHTKLNGVDIYNKKKKALKDGDKIELACQPELTVTFNFIDKPEK